MKREQIRTKLSFSSCDDVIDLLKHLSNTWRGWRSEIICCAQEKNDLLLIIIDDTELYTQPILQVFK